MDTELALPLLGILAASFGVSIGLGIIIPLLPLYARDLGLSISAIGFLVASFSFARVVLDVAGALIFRWFSERLVATTGAATVALGSLMTAWADGFGLLLAGRIVHGAGVALFLAAGLVYIARQMPSASRARTISMHHAALLLGGNIGPALGGLMGTIVGLRAPFYLAAAIGLMAIPLSWRVFPQSPSGGLNLASRRRRLDPGLRWTLAAALAATALSWGLRTSIRFTVIPLYVVEEVGSTIAFSGVLLSLMFFGDVVGLAAGGRAMDAFGRRRTALAGFTASAAVIAASGSVTSELALVALALSYGVFNGLVAVVPITIAADVNGGSASTITTTRVATDLGLLAAPWTGGILLDHTGYSTSFGWHAIASMVAAAFILSGRETRGLRGDGSLAMDVPIYPEVLDPGRRDPDD